MMRRLFFAAVLGSVLLSQRGGYAPLSASAAATAQTDDDARLSALLQQVERAFESGDRALYLGLLSPNADRSRAEDFLSLERQPGVTRVIVVERNRQHLLGTLPGSGYRLVVDAFIEYGDRARVATWQLDVKVIGLVEWRLADQDRLSVVDNLFRLSVNPTRQFRARDFKITSEDLELTLVDGSVFTVDTDRGITGLVLIGRGEMYFRPAPETEREQVRIFAGTDAIVSRFDSAYIRVGNFEQHADPSLLVAIPVDRRELRRAEQVFREESPKSFAVGLGDLTQDTWSLSLSPGDFLAEVRTRRFDLLTYSRTRSKPEDVSVFDRRRNRNIAIYASAEQLARHGLFYNEDDLAAYDVLDYDIDLAAVPTPNRQWIEGQATLRLRIRSPLVRQITLRLADPLVVHSIVSEELGYLFNLRMRNQNKVLINLPMPLARDQELSLTVTYSGRLAPQEPGDRETLRQWRRGWPGLGPTLVRGRTGEANYLYSNRSYWYPQALITDYATAHLRLTIPAELACVATGEVSTDSPTLIPGQGGSQARKQYEFTADRPVRYLAFLVSRFARADQVRVAFGESFRGDGDDPHAGNSRLAAPKASAIWGGYDMLNLTVEANPLQIASGRALIARAVDIAQFYHSIVGDSPYPSFTLALVENPVPGGHSPGYFASLNRPPSNMTRVWRNDPASFDGYPEFFLAHEMAHQWWGQAVGWQNYHEQWLSEGFAQYFAALYAERQHGPQVFTAMLRQLRKWAIDRSDQGPVYLGYRLGHIQNDGRVFRALVYNKGAAVLHMLRRILGDEIFFLGIQRFYAESRFLKVGTDDLRAAMEAEAGRPLDRFFTRWIYNSTLPQISFSYRVESAENGRQEVVLRFVQDGDIFDIPVTVTLQYADRRSVDVLVAVTDRTVEMRVPLDGRLRRVTINNDDGTLAEIRTN